MRKYPLERNNCETKKDKEIGEKKKTEIDIERGNKM